MEFFYRHFLIDLMNLFCLRDGKLNENRWNKNGNYYMNEKQNMHARTHRHKILR